ncbi:helicase C-terminal domain-containing protein [Periweissella ghanensis]|uniref:3'-5' exonuclease DinG n=1 Tax=Periweissella ghanensis TaxID=467997 RepID=A0ABN8BPB0_9LACO|nr:helicase C-terminal domain-containing protein [Periweissella ghanensis]MCM0600658.1 DEAD/DEAH box helicase [Periweissella ghanensis]CAH0418452.1 3'-5' exonuclease DinG [Periweissella ghanensis]
MLLENQKFAVVDIETTGTNIKDGARIIQIGAVIVQNNKIIQTFATNINPEAAIPPAVIQLTGITNKDVHDAPLFSDVAQTLWNFLQDTIFVAHNINFDFPFLVAEFKRVGLPTLEIDGIDTVPLAQILYPTAPGYRLADLSQYLAIKHLQPHRADSDAQATARLFMDLWQVARDLPLLTLQTLQKFANILPRQTSIFFDALVTERQANANQLAAHLVIANDLVLTKANQTAFKRTQPKRYPNTQRAKEQLFKGAIEYRGEQAKFMNLIYNNFAHPNSSPMMLEAPTGMGKTLGYLLPFAYLSQTGRKTVISVPTFLLQEQVMHVIDQKLAPFLPFKIQATMVKGRQHYIDLTKFRQILFSKASNYADQFLKMRIVVWLTMTTTGDLDEIQIGNPNTFFRQQIAYTTKNDVNEFGELAFYERQQAAIKNADMLVVNHAFLIQHADEFTEQPFLVVDEAHQLAPSVLAVSRNQFSFASALKSITQLQGLLLNNHNRDIFDIFRGSLGNDELLKKISSATQGIAENLNQLLMLLYRHFLLNVQLVTTPLGFEKRISSQGMATFFGQHTDLITRLQNDVTDLKLALAGLNNIFETENQRWLANDFEQMAAFQAEANLLEQQLEVFWTLHAQVLNDPEKGVFWLNSNSQNQSSNLILSSSLINTEAFFTDKMYPYFQAPIFVGATLFSSARSQYVFDQLNLVKDNVKVKRFADNFPYEAQAQLVLVSDAPDPRQTNQFMYSDYLARQIKQLLTGVSKKALILFNSLATIEQVTKLLHGMPELHHFTILAQGVSGSNSKILRKFKDEEHVILLGSGGFWEGIDMPSDEIELLIITRLPFENPESPLIQAQNDWLEQQHRNPFYNLSLPKAILRLRQGIGRILRTPDAIGMVIILDARIVNKKYGKTIINALPKKLPINTITSAQIAATAADFFKRTLK